MKLQLVFLFVSGIALLQANDIDNETNEEARKHYGMSYSVKCKDYLKTFSCMSTCKSIGYQVFRMDHRCKCSCHELQTTTILPFFKWLTNGTTRKRPKTQSVQLYHIVGTLSPPPTEPGNDTTIMTTQSDSNATPETGNTDTPEGEEGEGKEEKQINPEADEKAEKEGEEENKEEEKQKTPDGQNKPEEKAEAEEEGEAEEESEAKKEGEAEKEGKIEEKAETEHETEPEGETKAEGEAEPEGETKAETESEVEAEPKPEGEAEEE